MQLALAPGACAGALALALSTPRYLTAWGFWLDCRGCGCGSGHEPLRALHPVGVA